MHAHPERAASGNLGGEGSEALGRHPHLESRGLLRALEAGESGVEIRHGGYAHAGIGLLGRDVGRYFRRAEGRDGDQGGGEAE